MRKTIHRVAKIRRQRLVQVIEAAAVLAALAPASALAQSWNTGSGNWSVAGNWNPMSVPADGGSAYIVNNDSVNRTVTYDVDGSAITLNQFEIDQTGSGSDTLVDNFSDNNLTANYETIGDNGQGALVSYDLTNSVNNYLWVGLGAGSSGTYTMNSIYNAVLTMGASGVETIGQYGTGTFNNIGNINFPTFSNYYGSTLYLGYGAVTGSGTYNLDGGLLTGDGNAYVGYSGRGIFNQTNDGSNTVGGELDIAANPGSTGSYTMGNYGGTLTVNGTGLYVGGTSTAAGGNGTLTVGVGSSATVAGTLQVYPGASNSVSLNGGTITAAALTLGSFSQLHWNSGTIHLTNEALYIDSTSNANFSGSSLTLQAGQNLSVDVGESVGDTGTGTITQNGGSNTMNGSSNSLLIIGGGAGSSGATSGTGTYNLSGGSLFVNGGEYLGYDGSGSIVQTGGNNSISGELVMGVLGSSTYSLSGGSLTAGAEIIGYLGTGAIFTQTSGTNTISSGGSGTLAGELSIGLLGGSVGTYTLSGGTLNVEGSVYVGGSDPADYGAGGIGTLNVNENSGASELTITGTLKVYPGSTVNLSYSKIQTGALDLSGIYSALNWSVGTLELTNTNVVLDSTVVGPTDPLGSNMTIASGQTFIVDLDETIGGVGGGSLTVNGTHVVGETLTLTSNGTLTVNSGGSLSFESFLQEGGVVNGTITNTGSFTYQSGVFNARLINQGSVSLGNNFTAGNGIENDTYMYVNAGQTLNVNGQGMDNLGSLTMYGGTIGGNGSFTNDYGGTLSASSGSIYQNITNNGTFNVNGVFTIAGATNYGQVTIVSGANLRTLASPNNGTLINEAGGVVEGEGGAISIPFTNSAGAEVEVPAGNSLSISSAWTNSGLVSLMGVNAVLNGGAITNSSTIQGAGHVSPNVVNSGVIDAFGGELDLAGSDTNTSTGQIEASTDGTVMFLQGLSTNAGTIALAGGIFDNDNRALANTGSIEGNGVFRAGSWTNSGAINLTAGSSFYGPLTNNGPIHIYGSSTTFYGNVSNGSGGTIKVTGGAVYFLGNGGASVSGLYTSDPSDNYFNNLTINSDGSVSGGSGDRFFLINNTTMNNAGTFTNGGTLSATTVINSGNFTQTGPQIWSSGATFTNTAGTATFGSDAGSATSSPLAMSATGGKVTFNSNQHLASLSITGSATVDLTGNTIFVTSTPAATIRSYLISAYDHGRWDGNGLTSSLAAANAKGSTTVGYVVTSSAVEVKYTWLGDANLDGVVNSADLAAISSTGTTWATGDFNYDGVVNSDDYALFMLGSAYGSVNISTTLPEPALLAASIIGAFFSSFPRRRR